MAYYLNEGGGEPELVGSFSGDTSIDVSDFVRPNDTVNNFVIEVSAITLYAQVSNNDDPMYHSNYAYGYPSKVLSGTTLTVRNTRVDYSWSYASGNHYMHSYASLSYRVWHV